MFTQTPEQNKELAHKGKNAAARRFAKAYHRPEEDAKLRQETLASAVTQARDKHPNIAIVESELRVKWQKEQAEKQRRKLSSDVAYRTRHTVEYFQGHKASSFIKTIPMRSSEGMQRVGFDGDYQELAKTSLDDAFARKQADGSIPLFGFGVERQRIAAQEQAEVSIKDIARTEKSYMEGASTALWKLGFINVSDERQIAYAGGRFNPDIEWRNSDTPHTITASLPFDSNNELHNMLITEGETFSSPCIELEMASDPHDPRMQPYMSLRVVEAATPAMAMASA